MKKGFSLGEILIALVIIGVISMMMIPTFKATMKGNNKVLYKSAFKNVEQSVSDLIMDLSKTPIGEFENAPPNYNFCMNFGEKLNTLEPMEKANCQRTVNSANPIYSEGNANFISTNGMSWFGFKENFTPSKGPGESDEEYKIKNPNGLPAGTLLIYVDVDGPHKGKNTNDTEDEDQDVFKVLIYKNGKVSIPKGTTNENNYLRGK